MSLEYYSIVFLQGEDYAEYNSQVNCKENYTPFDYLMQWYNGDESEYDAKDKPLWGSNDKCVDELVTPYMGTFKVYENIQLDYVSLTVIKEEGDW